MALFVGAAVSFLVAVVLWFDNPTVSISASDIDDGGSSGEASCSIAPWDAGLNDNSDGPGGEHTQAFHDEVAAACYAANTRRFNASIGCGALALLLLGGGAVLAVTQLRTPSTT
ncbi:MULTISPECIES: hypothetical protein [unclassified Nocardioides]|uniref:hypothetical protein n=1 Tax=unclassified Nocardioides TaxID=2615069 RepID=UPI0006FBA7B4|nr:MULTISPECIES: hypothetical protein [unclassified Nocardioides]KRA32347.1 hypothetical protein ASD81_12250 [Nocardioides sp. Root614]KRA88999.1 hypothetical protein ASD84_12515 [Nocardioides sp. Root682]